MKTQKKNKYHLAESLISQQSLEIFNQFSKLAPQKYTDSLDDLSADLLSQCRNWKKPDNNHTPAKLAKLLFEKKFSWVSPLEKKSLQISLLSKLAIKTPNLIESENLPNSILKYYPSMFDRLSVLLNKVAEASLDDSYNLFNRVGFVLGINVPCGAQMLDLRSTIPFTSAVLSIYRERSPRTFIRYLRCNGYGTWLRGHTDLGYLDEFNEEGWDKFYLRIAELLLRRKKVRGLVGTSWFYDPQLLNISPRLSYLQLRQIDRGAFLLRHRSTAMDIMFATQASATRRKLHQEGLYTPVSYSLIWDRNEIIKWAKGVWGDEFNKNEHL